MKKYIALIITIIVLAGGAFVTQKWFIEFSGARGMNEDRSSQATISHVIPVFSEGAVLTHMEQYAASGAGFSFEGRDFPGLGFFVEEMNGKRASDGFYWILHINGVPSEFGASSARVSPGDRVEWKYEKGY